MRSKLTDAFIEGGSGGLVRGLEVKNGARVVLVNQGETPYDEAISLRI